MVGIENESETKIWKHHQNESGTRILGLLQSENGKERWRMMQTLRTDFFLLGLGFSLLWFKALTESVAREDILREKAIGSFAAWIDGGKSLVVRGRLGDGRVGGAFLFLSRWEGEQERRFIFILKPFEWWDSIFDEENGEKMRRLTPKYLLVISRNMHHVNE